MPSRWKTGSTEGIRARFKSGYHSDGVLSFSLPKVSAGNTEKNRVGMRQLADLSRFSVRSVSAAGVHINQWVAGGVIGSHEAKSGAITV